MIYGCVDMITDSVYIDLVLGFGEGFEFLFTHVVATEVGVVPSSCLVREVWVNT